MAKLAPEEQFKTPRENAPFDFDFSEDLISGESISSATFNGTSDLSVGAPAISGAVVQFKISGGTLEASGEKKRYQVGADVATSNANTYEGCGILVVETCG